MLFGKNWGKVKNRKLEEIFFSVTSRLEMHDTACDNSAYNSSDYTCCPHFQG